MPNFERRSQQAEWMDSPDVDPEALTACLADLAKVNTVTRARPPTLRWLARACRSMDRGQGFTLLDIGYGQGDMLRAIHAWAVEAGLRPRLCGMDLSRQSAAAAAAAATAPDAAIEYRVGDVFELATPFRTDFMISSLVAHHMSDDRLIDFIRLMERTTQRGWFINDLHRHALAFYGFKALAAVAGWHPMVRHDGPISVARAFRREDWRRLVEAAGVPLGAVAIAWRFPFRICVSRLKPA